MLTPDDLARLATLKRNTTILESTAPASAGGVSVAMIGDAVRLSTWTSDYEIDIDLTVQEVFALRDFLNAVVDAALNGTDYPAACLGSRK